MGGILTDGVPVPGEYGAGAWRYSASSSASWAE